MNTSGRTGLFLLGSSPLHEFLGVSQAQGEPLSLGFVIGVLAFATVYCNLIALTYRLTYQGQEYRRNFAHSIILLGVLVAIVIALIGNNVARAFGVFGALAIIRYRVPVDDAKDLTIILSSVVIGLACGVGQYLEAGAATLFIIALIVLLRVSSLGLGQPDHHKLKKWEYEAQQAQLAQQQLTTAPDDGNEHHKHKHHKHDKPRSDEKSAD
jgi:uncharacterized membrane protein YhiD involved in acid resistance